MISMPLAYVLFFDPLPIWTRTWVWPLLLLPLCLVVALVYKCVRCRDMSTVWREATVLFITIVLGMVVTAVALAGLTAIMD
jgi:hypothetical protein